MEQREPLRAVGSVKEIMPKDAYQDMYWCMHFSDDWEEDRDVEEGTDERDQFYGNKKFTPSLDVERHCQKFEPIEDGFNCRWKDCVIFGRWTTAGEVELRDGTIPASQLVQNRSQFVLAQQSTPSAL